MKNIKLNTKNNAESGSLTLTLNCIFNMKATSEMSGVAFLFSKNNLLNTGSFNNCLSIELIDKTKVETKNPSSYTISCSEATPVNRRHEAMKMDYSNRFDALTW